MTAWSTPERAQRRRHLERPGPAPDDDDRVLARRERARAQLRHRFAARSRRACDLEHPVHHPRMGDQERLDPRAGQDQAAQRPGRHDVRDRRLAEDDRHLAEELAATEPRALRAVDDDRRLAVEDDVEPGAGEALAEDLLALGEDGLLEQVDDALELRFGQVGEQREAGDRIDQFLALGHDRQWCQKRRLMSRPRRSLRAVDGPPSRGAAWPSAKGRSEDRMTLTRDRKTALLSAARLFDGVDAEGMDRDRRGRRRGRVPGRPRRSPDRARSGRGFFVIVEGGARVIRDGQTVATLGPGDFFGELSVLDGQPRIAQVVADGPTTCLALAHLGLRGRPARGTTRLAGDPARARRPAARPDRSRPALTAEPGTAR